MLDVGVDDVGFLTFKVGKGVHGGARARQDVGKGVLLGCLRTQECTIKIPN